MAPVSFLFTLLMFALSLYTITARFTKTATLEIAAKTNTPDIPSFVKSSSAYNQAAACF